MREKKSESLEVRLPHRLKQAFMDRCRAEGASASEAVRRMIEAYVERPAPHRPTELAQVLKPQFAIPAFAAAGLAAVFLLATQSQAGPDLREAFDALDADGNGAVTLAEFGAARRDRIIFVGRPQPGPPPEGAKTIMLPLTRTPELERAVAEGARRRPLSAGPLYARIDADRSGAVSFAEYEAHHKRVNAQSFESLDADRDGRITGDEFWRPALPAQASPALKESLRQTFVRLDANRDGAISRSEYAGF
jgi:Ca2+-binding EF-hand superfamily protein